VTSGHIWVADHDGVYVIKLVGDVRLTLCLSFDHFISSMLSSEVLKSIIFDLREVTGIDSTTLGLMAKISIGSVEKGLGNPVAVSASPSIERLLESMGFEDILDFLKEPVIPCADSKPLNEEVGDEGAVEDKVIEAHEILMNLNSQNKVEFRELVETLQEKKY